MSVSEDKINNYLCNIFELQEHPNIDLVLLFINSDNLKSYGQSASMVYFYNKQSSETKCLWENTKYSLKI